MKTCKDCGKAKEDSSFLPDSRTVDRKAKICTECRAGKEGLSVDDYETIWLDKALLHWGTGSTKEYQREYAKSNRKRRLAWTRAYEKRNPELKDKWRRNYRARKLEAGGQISDKEWEARCVEYSNCCAYCGVYMEKPEMDHVIPLSRGGSHVIDNVVPACRSCNAKKGNKLLTLAS